MDPLITAADDVLLRKLSQATRSVGEKIIVRPSERGPGYEARIINVIILPFSHFHQDQFLDYYRLYNENAVKALKELCRNFPYTPDFLLDIGYVLDKTSQAGSSFGLNVIVKRSDFDFTLTRTLFRSATF